MADETQQPEQDTPQDGTPKLGVKEFAAKIKAKYPDYAGIDDSTLVQKIIAKYPEYKDQIDFSQKKNPLPTSSNVSSQSVSKAQSSSQETQPVQQAQQKPQPFDPATFMRQSRANILQNSQPAQDNTIAVQPSQTKAAIDSQLGKADYQKRKVEINKEAVVNSTAQYLKNKGINAPVGSVQFNQQLAKTQDLVNSGQATVAINPDGQIGLKRVTGFFENIKNGWNEATKSADEADDFTNNMTAQQRVDYVKSHDVKQPDQFIGEQPSLRGSLGHFLGGAAPFVGKAVAGGLVGSAAVAAAPESMGASLAGLPTAMSFILTAPDMANQGAQQEIIRRYQILKNQNPDMSDVDAMEEAGKGALAGGIGGILTNAALMGTGLKTPISLEAKNVVGKTLQNIVKSGVHMGAVSAGVTAAQELEGEAEGIHTSTSDKLKDVVNSFKENATTGAMLTALMHGVPKVLESAIKYSLKDTPPEQIRKVLQANENAGTVPEGTTDKVMKDISSYNDALNKTVDGLSPEATASVAGLIQKKNSLIEESKTKDDSFKPVYKEKIDAIDQQIKDIQRTGKPFEHEIDEVTGKPYQQPTYDDVAQQQVQELAGKIAKGKQITDPTDLQTQSNFPKELEAELQRLQKEEQTSNKGKENPKNVISDNINDYLKSVSKSESPAEPVSSPAISDLKGEVVMNGERGRLKTDDENNVIFDNGEKQTFLGKTTDENFNKTKAGDLGIKPVPKVEVKGDNVKIDGEDFTLNHEKEGGAFGKDKSDNVVSVNLINGKGEERTIRDKDLALDIAIEKNHDEFNSRPEPKDYAEHKQVIDNHFNQEHGQKASDIIDSMPEEVADTFAAMDNKIEAIAPEETQAMVIRSSEWADKAREGIKNGSSSEKEKADAIKMLDKFDKDLNKYYGKLEKQRKGQADADVKREQAESLAAAKQRAKTAREKAKQLEIEEVEQENLATTTESRNRTYKRVSQIEEPTDADGIALQYFAGGGKVDEGEMAGEVTGKRKSSMNRTGKTSDAEGNTLFEKNGSTVDRVAHNLWDNLPEHLQEGTDPQDIRNSLISVMGSHDSRFSAAKEFVEKYDPEFVEARHNKEQADAYEAYEKKLEEDEQNYLTEKGNEQNEIEQDPEYIKHLIRLYEAETISGNGERATSGSETESNQARSTSKVVEPERTDRGERPSDVRGSAEDQSKPNEGKPESSKKQVGDALRNFADIIDKGKISKLGGFKSSTGFDAVWDGSLTVVAETLRKTADLADAIQAGLQHIKNSDWYKGLTDKKDFDEKYVAHLETEYGKFVKEQPVDPAHPDYKPLDFTAIKNDVVNSEREGQGKEPLKSSGDGTMERAEQTKAKIESGEISEEHIRDLTQAIATGDKDFVTNLKPDEIQHVLLFDRQTLQNKRSEIESELIGARETKNEGAIERVLVKQAQNDLLMEANDKAANKTGREWSDAGRARQLIMRNDYSFEALKRRAKAASKDGVLDKPTEDRLRELSKLVEQKDAQLLEKNEAIAAADREIAELKELNNAARNRKSEVSAFDDLKKETKNQIRQQGRRTIEKIKHDRENIKASLKNKWKNHQGNLGMNNIIPLDMVPDLIKLAKSYIEEGLAVGKEAVLEHIIDRVHRDVVDAIGDVDKTTVRDAITGYGKIKKPNSDPIDTAFRDISAQGRLVSSIELAEKGEPPLKSGQQRDKPSAEQRRLQKELNKAIKDNNIQVKSPEEQIKTSLDAAKTRLKNQIEDLSDAIDRNEKIVKDRKGIEYDKEANDLKTQRDELRDEYDKIFGTNKELTDEDRIERASNAVQKSIEKLNERITNKDFSQNKRVDLKSPELDALKKQREDLKKVYKDLMDAEGETNRRKLEALKKNISKRTAYLNDIKNTGNLDKFIADRTKKKTILDAEATRMKAEQQKVKNDVDNMIRAREFQNMSSFQKGLHWAGRFSKGVLISNPAVLMRIVGSVIGRATMKAPTATVTYGLSKILPGLAKGAHTEAITSAKDLAGHLATYYSTLFSKENFEGMKFAFKHHNTAEDLTLGRNFHKLPVPDIKVTNLKTAIQASFFNTLKVLDKNASLHGAGKSLASLPEYRAYQKTIAVNLIREGITAEELGQPTLQEAINQLAFRKSLRAKFMQENTVTGMQGTLEEYFRRKKMPELAEVLNGILPITKISSNYISEALTKIPFVGNLAAYKPISKILAHAFGDPKLSEQEKSILLRTLTYQGVGALTYALGWALHGSFSPFYKSSANKFAQKKNPDEEDNSLLVLFETLSHFPDALVFNAGVSHAWVWDKYDEEHPGEKSMATFMGSMPDAIMENSRNIASSSPYLSTGNTVLNPLITGKGTGKAAANFVKSRIPFSTTLSEVAQGKIPVLNKLGIKSGHEEEVKPYEVGLYPKTFMDNIGIGVPGWRQKILKKLYDEKYNTEKPEKTDAELDAADERKDQLEENKEKFEGQLRR